ncbi:MAG TPA: C1 family peptidase [Candidatus Paceibacterota bacterium]|nr:C1 family peptidase [Candidatus Paceibacterota bacterium]
MKNLFFNKKNFITGFVGLIIGLIISILLLRSQFVIFGLPYLFPCNSGIVGGCWTSASYSNLVYFMVIGFIIGFILSLIHSFTKNYKNRKIITGFMFLFILILITQLPFGSSIRNPSAVYCNELGYEYVINHTDMGDIGLCFIINSTNNLTLNAWDFFQGKVGKEYSYCSRLGYDIITLNDGKNPYSPEYAACILKNNQDSTNKVMSVMGSNEIVIPLITLMNLTEKVNEPNFKLNNITSQKSLSSVYLIQAQQYYLPSSFDWRNYNGYNWLTSTKDQGFCGSCWAFASVGAVESKYKIEQNKPNLNIDLSEQYLVSDCSDAGDCNGGFTDDALEFIRTQGITDENCFPYSWTGLFGKTCSERCSDWYNRLYKIYDWGYVTKNENEIKRELIEKGPLVVVIYVDGGWWDSGGLYRCDESNPGGLHAVVLVGYNDSGKYWIVKNSWGWLGNLFEGVKIGYGECGLSSLEIDYVKVFPPIDSDGDSIPDEEDLCPQEYGNYCYGCPVPSCSIGYAPICPIYGIPYCSKVSCAKDNDCGNSSIDYYCSGNYYSCSNPIYWTCQNPGTLNSNCTKSDITGTCGYCKYGCLNETGLCLNKSTETIEVISPEEKVYNLTKINFEVRVNKSCDLYYSDYVFSPSEFWNFVNNSENYIFPENLEYSSLCKSCMNYSKFINFKQGFHYLSLKCNNNPEINISQIFLVDSINPRIISSEPKNGKFTNGSDFYVKYNEDYLSYAQIKTDFTLPIKPTVELFVMTYCPYGAQAEKGIIPVIKLLGSRVNFKIRYLNYFMHGGVEEEETYRQICIREENKQKFIPYIECFVQQGNATKCLNDLKLNVDVCMSQRAKYYYSLDSSLSTSYKATGSPMLFVNGKEIDFYPRSQANSLKIICSYFKNSPTACSKTLNESNPSPGFGEYVMTSWSEEELLTSSSEINQENIVSCSPGKNQECYFNLNLSDYDGRNIEYSFYLLDFSENSQESRKTKINVDTTPPKITNFTYSIGKNFIIFNMSTNELNFDKVGYINLKDGKAKFVPLCTRLKYGNCYSKKYFQIGAYSLKVQVLDKAGNSDERVINFSI